MSRPSILLLLATMACSTSTLEVEPPSASAEEGFRTAWDALDLAPGETRDLPIQVPLGAPWLDIEVLQASGDVAVQLLAPDGGEVCTTDCRTDSPLPGVWQLRLTSAAGATAVEASWSLGAGTAEVVLAQRELSTTPTHVTLSIPDRLGELSANASGDRAWVTATPSDCEDDWAWCDVSFPRGPVTFSAGTATGDGMLDVRWIPATLLVDRAGEGPVLQSSFEASHGFGIAVRAPGATVSLLRDGITLCTGWERCQVDQQVGGNWTAIAQGDGALHLQAGILTTPEDAEPGPTRDEALTILPGTHVEHRMAPDDEAWYRLPASPGFTLRATLLAAGHHHFTCEIVDAQGRTIQQDRFTSGFPVFTPFFGSHQHCDVAVSDAQRDTWLRIRPRDPVGDRLISTTVVLEAQRPPHWTPSETCRDTSEPNDEAFSAAPLPSWNRELVYEGDGDDWYEVEVPRSSICSVEVLTDAGDDLPGEVQVWADEFDTIPRDANWDGPVEMANYWDFETTQLLRVGHYGWRDQCTTYDVTVRCESLDETCEDDADWDVGWNAGTATPLHDGVTRDLTAVLGNDDWHLLDVAPGETVSVGVRGDRIAHTLRTGADLVHSALDDTAAHTYTNPTDQTVQVFLVVEGFACTSYDVNVVREPATCVAAPAPSTPPAPLDLPLGRFEDLELVGDGASYDVTVPPGSLVRAEVTDHGASVGRRIGLGLYDGTQGLGTANADATGWTAVTRLVDSSSFRLRLWTAWNSADTCAPYDLEVSAETCAPDDAHEPNDQHADATLDAAAGQLTAASPTDWVRLSGAGFFDQVETDILFDRSVGELRATAYSITHSGIQTYEASSQPIPGGVRLTWEAGSGEPHLRIEQDGDLVCNLPYTIETTVTPWE